MPRTTWGVLELWRDPPDRDEARRWFTVAAEAGNAHAQYCLGMYATELDPPDLDAARRWFTAAAEGGDPFAQYNLGQLLAPRSTRQSATRAAVG
jgi:sugar phosphate isomerase/epimerase